MADDVNVSEVDVQFAAVVQKLEEARVAGTLEFRGFLNTVIEVLKDGRFSQADFPAVCALVEGLYDEYIAPLDIPGIGPVIEALVDEGIRRSIRPALQAVFDRYVPS